MSDHSSDFPKSGMPDFLKRMADSEKLGATGKYPSGKLLESDEGEIRFAIGADPTTRKVIINFGKPVAWMGMEKDQAIAIGETLIARAKELPDG